MKSFFWKFFWCLLPCGLAGWVAVNAINRYYNGEPGGFKLGVDLVGGTILVYEIDLRKQLETQGDTAKQQTAGESTKLLAESLKRRIDPNDLYNIVIRPASGEGRVEIILPTGGTHRSTKAENAWDELLEKVKAKYDLAEKPEIGRGKVQELADRVHLIKARKIWQENIFNTPTAWNDLLRAALVNWEEEDKLKLDTLSKLPVGQLQPLVDFLLKELGSVTTEKAIEGWLKEQAWLVFLDRACTQWPELRQYREHLLRYDERYADLKKDVARETDKKRKEQALARLKRHELNTLIVALPPDSNEQLVSLIQAKGGIIGQAGLVALEGMVGDNIVGGKDPAGKDFPERATIEEFITKNYGPSLQSIGEYIDELHQKSGLARDLTVEEVQRIKDLVAKVGSLEFRILANNKDDKEAIKDAKDLIESLRTTQELKDLQEKGLPPPPPRDPVTREPKVYDITLPRANKSKLRYAWVELGPQERRSLNLDNAIKNDPTRVFFKDAWLEAEKARIEGLATQLPDPTDQRKGPDRRLLLQGALFFSRECKDRNLPEEERRKKQIEYFVLTRLPEIVDGRETPKIDGRYLVNASPDRWSVTPAVHFVFNNTGGELFGTITRKNVPDGGGTEATQVKRHLAIILDGLVSSAPTINSEIRTHGQISGNFTRREVDELVNILRSGALPATLKPQPVSESTIGATLGQDTITKGVWSVLFAFLAVIVFMIFYYRFAGLVASIALMANLLLTIGFMVAVQATFTLPGLAGLVLMLGMAVDANVLIYERLREERERGASLALAIRNGYERALPTIIDTHLSSIFTAIVLYVVGNDQLKGFGVSLTVGLIISLFTSLFMTRVLFDYWLKRGWLHKLSMLRLFARPNIDFMGIRYAMFALTLTLALVGAAVFVGRGSYGLNIDFVGGTAYGGELLEGKNISELRGLLEENRQKALLKVEVKEEPNSDGRRFQFTYINPDGSKTVPRQVSLADSPPGGAAEDRQANLQQRASQLPDVSVEMIFPSQHREADPSKTKFFNIRTTEKEMELVQATLDRLLSTEQGGQLQSLLRKRFMAVAPLRPTGTTLFFYQKQPPANFRAQEDEKLAADTELGREIAPPSFVKSLFDRLLLREFAEADKGDSKKFDRASLPFIYEMNGEGNSDQGRYHQIKLTFTPALDSKELLAKHPDVMKKVSKVLQDLQVEFAARPQPESLEVFDSQLAAETRLRAMWAIIASWGAILMYLWFRFGNWTFGLAAVICLIHDLFFTLGAIAFCHFIADTFIGQWLLLEDFKLDLPAVAALLTLVGYSVNDTIVVFDRIREVRGKNPDLTVQMINDSINQTLSRTVLASLTTWLVVFVLFVWGGPGVHLFAFVMVVGVIVGTYSSIYIASPLLLMFGEGSRGAARVPERPTRPVPEGSPT